VPSYGCPPIRRRVPGLPIVLPGRGDPCANFVGSGAVVFRGFGVRWGRVKDVTSSHGYVWIVTAELRVPHNEGEGTRVTHSRTGLGRHLREVFEVRCGRVKRVSLSLCSVWGVTAELRVPPYEGRAAGLPVV